MLVIVLAGGLMNLVSGSINALCLTGDYTETVTHMTGTTTNVGEYFARGRWTPMFYNLVKVLVFCLGAMLSGSYLGSESFQGGIQVNSSTSIFFTSLFIVPLASSKVGPPMPGVAPPSHFKDPPHHTPKLTRVALQHNSFIISTIYPVFDRLDRHCAGALRCDLSRARGLRTFRNLRLRPRGRARLGFGPPPRCA